MIKRYCDFCGAEVEKQFNTITWRGNSGSTGVDICNKCWDDSMAQLLEKVMSEEDE